MGNATCTSTCNTTHSYRSAYTHFTTKRSSMNTFSTWVCSIKSTKQVTRKHSLGYSRTFASQVTRAHLWRCVWVEVYSICVMYCSVYKYNGGLCVYVCAYYTCTCTLNSSDLLTLSKLLLRFVKVKFKAQTFNQLCDRIPVGVTFLEIKNKDQHDKLQRTKRLHINVPLHTMYVGNIICFISVIKIFLFLSSGRRFKKFHN